jgi:hypothetical protein
VKPSLGKSITRKKTHLTFLLIAATWALSFLGPLSIGIIPILVLACYFAVRVRSAVPLAVLFVNPLAVAFVIGAVEWSRPRPAFVGPGLPSPSASNLDRDSRIWWNIGGCIVYGNEWVYDAPHNFGLRSAAKLFGPPRGTYHGVYPTVKEVEMLTEKADVTPNAVFFGGTVVADGKQVVIGKSCAELIRRDLGQDLFDEDGVLFKGKVTAALVNSECLIIRIVSDGDFFSGNGDEHRRDAAMLIDVTSMLPFARYSLAGSLPRIPRFELKDHGGYGSCAAQNNDVKP